MNDWVWFLIIVVLVPATAVPIGFYILDRWLRRYPDGRVARYWGRSFLGACAVLTVLSVGSCTYMTWDDLLGTARAKASPDAAAICRPSVEWCLFVVRQYQK
jgi:hypothetical protein